MMVAGDDSAAEENPAGEGGVVAADHLPCYEGIQFVRFEFFEFCGGWHQSSCAELLRKNRVSKRDNRQWVRCESANCGDGALGRACGSLRHPDYVLPHVRPVTDALERPIE